MKASKINLDYSFTVVYNNLYFILFQREKMTSIKYENLSQFPYTDKISAGEENRVDFIYQFVKYCYTESSNNFKYFHTAHYILGGPNEFPNYGDFPEAFTMVCTFSGIIYCSVESNHNTLQDFVKFDIFYFLI